MSKAFKVIALALTVASSLSGCVLVAASQNQNIHALDKVKANPMPGFELSGSGNGDSFCVPGSYCSANARADFTNTKPYASRADFCKEFIAWAPKVGVHSWWYDPDYIGLPIKGHEGAAQFACIGARNFALIGETNKVTWNVTGTLEEIRVETTMSTEEGMDDPRMALKTWDDAVSQLFAGNKLSMDALSAIETYRLANPKANPNSMKTIETALKDIKLPDGSKLIKDKKGIAHYLYLPVSPELSERCINITPFDPSYFKMDNPGSGFVTLSGNDGDPMVDEFAYTLNTPCPTN